MFCRRTTRRTFAAWILAGVVAVCLLATPSASAQWLQWGGPNQDFKADAKGLAASWPTDGPNKLWQRELGDGYSAILADAGRLYTMFRSDDKEAIISLDAKTGKTIWEHRYDSSPREDHAHEFGDGPRSTPLIAGDRLFAIGVEGKMHCLDKKSGKVYWKRDLWTEFEGNVLNHGYASSPIAYKNTVITLVGGKGAGIVAFDQASGDVVWKNQDFENSYSSPKIIRVDGEDQLVTFMAEQIIGVDPNSGALKWEYPCANRWKQNVCMPTWDEASNTLFFSASQVGSRGLKLKRDGDKTKVEEIWFTRKIHLYHVTSVKIGDYVYGSTGNRAPNFFSAINMKTGEIAWRERGFAKATCVLADGRIIILDEDGNLALVTATPDKFTVHSRFELFDKVAWTVPTIVGKTMYVRDKEKIMALDIG
ncbi:MAG: PQQ-like beta-propeller repeat protein [Planctomycetes bacterium]|nr:PQQ-like beta-propeller repeat protein [Planctomycetota bacterium]